MAVQTESSTKMEDHFESFSEHITEWDTIRDVIELDLDDPPYKEDRNRFPRKDFVLYGTTPKLEQKVFVKCRDCAIIFNPLDISYHRNCVGTYSPTKVQVCERRSKNRGGSRSKKILNNFAVPPITGKTYSPNRSINKDKGEPKTKLNQSIGTTKVQEMINIIPESEIKGTSPDIPSPSCLSNDSLSLDGDSSSPKVTSSVRTSKKSCSRKAKSAKEFDPDLHCGVMDAHKGPCLRSITCSNHRIQLKKLVVGRSKDIHQLITEKRLAKERDLLNQLMPEIDKIESVSLVEHIPVESTPMDVLTEVATSDMIEVKQELEVDNMKHPVQYFEALNSRSGLNYSMRSMSPIHLNSIKTMEIFDVPMKEEVNNSPLENFGFVSFGQENGMKSIINLDFTQTLMTPPKDEYEIKETESVQFSFQPMSPFREDKPPVKHESFVNIPVTENKHVAFKIPDMEVEENSLELYPTPFTTHSFGIKNFGGALLSTKYQIQSQRNDILRAVNDARINFPLDGLHVSRTNRNPCNLPLIDKDIDYKQMRVDPNLNHLLMQCEIRKPFDETLSDECLQENFGRNTFPSTIDFE